MKLKMAGATFFMLSAGAATVGALDNLHLAGSDTLEEVTNLVLAQCPGATAAGILYNGGGSTSGESAMGAATQNVAPMSRFLNPTAPVCAKGSTSEGIVIGLDGIAILTSQAQGGAACGGALAFSGGASHTFVVTSDGTATGSPIDCTAQGCTGPNATGFFSYTLTGFQDVLKLVYAGAPHTGATDCAGAIRKSLVNNYGNLFENACSGTTCTQLRHAFRRGDLSGTTDTLLAALGLPGLASPKSVTGATAKLNSYCNAFGLGNIFGGDSDYKDADPIRRTLDNNEQVSGSPIVDRTTGVVQDSNKTLGLVMVVEVPVNLDQSHLYNDPAVVGTQAAPFCDVGKFKLMKPAAGVTTCPDGGGLLIAKCFTPYIARDDVAPGAFNPHCLYKRGNPIQGLRGNGMDGRAYNTWVKLDQVFTDTSSVVQEKDGTAQKRPITGAFYRIHANLTNGPSTCQQTDSTAQIGCLVAASPCSMGYAGREAGVAPAVALTVGGIPDSQANIEKLVTSPGDPTTYPLSRKLFFNTIVGFDDPILATGELELAKCMGKNSIVNPIIMAKNFIPVPGGLFCQDFKEENATTGVPASSGGNGCASTATPVDACAVHGGNAIITP